jgi:hypothetical protein
MSWSIGYDENWKRDIGYGVPAYCDHPGCNNKIHRGISYVCGHDIYGGEWGCGLFFCSQHLSHSNAGTNQCCERCSTLKKDSTNENYEPFPKKEDHPDWIKWKLTDDSWKPWRDENKELVSELNKKVKP